MYLIYLHIYVIFGVVLIPVNNIITERVISLYTCMAMCVECGVN